MFNQWFKKEMALRGLTGFGGGATGLAANASGDAWEEAGITATGGTIHNNQENPDGTPYTWHVFPGGPRGPETNLTYDFDVSAVNGPGKFEYIMVGGGGIGGISPNPDPGPTYKGAGGGGAGGVICNFQSPPAQDSTTYHPFYPVSPGAQTASVQAYPISVGRAAGGNPAPERQGKNTTFLGLTAVGGGWGGHATGGAPAGPGGSGGGGGAPPGNTTGASGTTNQGKAGGDGENASAGGGGGAETGGGGASGAGGEGIEFPDDGFFKLSVGGITDNPAAPGIRYLAGGGGGGGPDGAGIPPGKGGFGGGGEAGNPDGQGGPADNWSGGGGGGAGGGPQTMPGGLGGQGMVFIRYIKN